MDLFAQTLLELVMRNRLEVVDVGGDCDGRGGCGCNNNSVLPVRPGERGAAPLEPPASHSAFTFSLG